MGRKRETMKECHKAEAGGEERGFQCPVNSSPKEALLGCLLRRATRGGGDAHSKRRLNWGSVWEVLGSVAGLDVLFCLPYSFVLFIFYIFVYSIYLFYSYICLFHLCFVYLFFIYIFMFDHFFTFFICLFLRFLLRIKLGLLIQLGHSSLFLIFSLFFFTLLLSLYSSISIFHIYLITYLPIHIVTYSYTFTLLILTTVNYFKNNLQNKMLLEWQVSCAIFRLFNFLDFTFFSF